MYAYMYVYNRRYLKVNVERRKKVRFSRHSRCTESDDTVLKVERLEQVKFQYKDVELEVEGSWRQR